MNNKLCYLVFALLIVACEPMYDKDSHDENCIELSLTCRIWAKTGAQGTNYTSLEFRQ